jgi:hypothetical protein
MQNGMPEEVIFALPIKARQGALAGVSLASDFLCPSWCNT